MRIGIPIVGIILLIMGFVWILQGTNILPGSFMTGQPFWAWMGILSVIAGAALLLFGLGRRAPR